MLISSFAINVLSVALILGFMLHFLRRQKTRTPSTRALVFFLGGVLVVFLCFVVIFSSIDRTVSTLAWCVCHTFVFAAAYMVRFAYEFLENPFERESRIVFRVCLLAACLVYPWYLYRVWSLEPVYNFEGNLFVYPNTFEIAVVITLEILWMSGVFVRKMRYFAKVEGEPKSFVRLFIDPPGRRTRAIRDLFLFFLSPLVVVTATVLAYQGLLSWVWVGHLIGTGFIIASFAFVVLYINNAAEPSTLMIKLTGISLGTVLIVFGIAANLALAIKQENCEAELRGRVQAQLPASTMLSDRPDFRYDPAHRDQPLSIGFSYLLDGETRHVWMPYRTYREQIHKAALPLMVILILAGAFVITVFPRFFKHCLVRPMDGLLAGVGQVNQGDLNVQVPVYVEDEIGFLAGSFNRMVKSVAQARNDLSQSLDRQVQLSDAYSCFVPREFLASLEKPDIVEIELGDFAQRTMTILFSDVRSFTSLSESMTAQETFHFINDYLGRIGPVVRNNGGFIDKYLGDGVMALFHSAEQAVQAALDMESAVALFNADREARNQAPIQIGVGIHTGHLMLGTVGEEKRMDGTVISDAVNLASRIEGLTKHFGVVAIISSETRNALKNPEAFDFRHLGAVRVKGKNEHVELYEVLSPGDGEKRTCRELFEQALASYRRGEFGQAGVSFEQVYAASNESDLAARLYVLRCRGMEGQSAPDSWDGVTDFDAK